MNLSGTDEMLRKVIIFLGIVSLLLVPAFGIFPVIIFFIVILRIHSLKNKKLSAGSGKITWTKLWEQITSSFYTSSMSSNKVENIEDSFNYTDQAFMPKPVKNYSPLKTMRDNVNNSLNVGDQPYKIEKTSKKWLGIILILIVVILIYLWAKYYFILPINTFY